MSVKHYNKFLDQKTSLSGDYGFDPHFMPDVLFPFQRDIVSWSLKKGRSAVFADCGLGKTLIELVFAENVCRHTKGNVIIFCPLAVSAQTVDEGVKFDIPCAFSGDGTAYKITVSNYEKMHMFDPKEFEGVILDESSIIKGFKGAIRMNITKFMRKIKYRLLCTATAAPNDYIELGTSSEALGYMGYMDMLNMFFKNDQNNSATGRKFGKVVKWRFRGHSEIPFWRWVSSWAIACRYPSDLGHDDGGFILPEKKEVFTLITTDKPLNGKLFHMPAVGFREERQESRLTVYERCQKVAQIADTSKPCLIWCHTNAEGNLLESLIPGSVQVAGRHSNEDKRERLIGFAKGDFRVLITKPKIGAWGLNYQHCDHICYFPSHSFEQYYQSVRRCWRFGQKNNVTVDIVYTEGQENIIKNMIFKESKAIKMFDEIIGLMSDSKQIKRSEFINKQILPLWLENN